VEVVEAQEAPAKPAEVVANEQPVEQKVGDKQAGVDKLAPEEAAEWVSKTFGVKIE